VHINSPRTDVEPILAAYPRPESIVTFGLSDCRLTALPKGFFRFPNLTSLTLEEGAFDGRILRGVSLPKLEWLALRGTGLRSLTKEDLAGFPALRCGAMTMATWRERYRVFVMGASELSVGASAVYPTFAPAATSKISTPLTVPDS
jgi:hypothetical protein